MPARVALLGGAVPAPALRGTLGLLFGGRLRGLGYRLLSRLRALKHRSFNRSRDNRSLRDGGLYRGRYAPLGCRFKRGSLIDGTSDVVPGLDPLRISRIAPLFQQLRDGPE